MLKAIFRLTWRSFKHMPRMALIGIWLILFAAAGSLLTLRYWVLPDIGRYHGDITAMASRVMGQPVIIGKIEADWRGLRPRLLLTDVRILDRQGQTALLLPRIDNVVSWTTLIAGEVRLYSLEFDRPELLIKRDAQGALHIVGLDLSSQISDQTPGQITAQAADANWLLQQARIVVRDARITWQDELRGQDESRAVPTLVLNRANLIVENSRSIQSFLFTKNSGHRHRFALHAQPPEELSGDLDIRGDFYGENFEGLGTWSGELYTQLEYVDIAAWKTWLPLPDLLNRGKGAVRGWLAVVEGKPAQFTADLMLTDIQAQLAQNPVDQEQSTPEQSTPAQPVFEALDLRGRVSWRDVQQGFEISTTKLSAHLKNGWKLPATDFYLSLKDIPDNQPDNQQDNQKSSGEIRTKLLDIGNFAKLANYFPVPDEVKKQLMEFAPQGVVSDVRAKWQGDADKLLNYEVKARFDNLSLQRVGKFPGFTGLSGSVDGKDSGGTLSLNASKMTVDAPLIMPEPLAFDTITAQLEWQVNDSGLEFKFNNGFLANEDVAGNFNGSYQAVPHSRGLIDLSVHLSRAAVGQTARYIPLVALNSNAHDWLRNALLGGQSDEFRLRLNGNLDDFPFEGNRKGTFQIQARATGVEMEYAKHWPRLENGVVDLLISGKRLEVNAPIAKTMGGYVQKISVVLPDMMSAENLLQVRGEAAGKTQRVLDFIHKSPLRELTGGVADSMATQGKGLLALQVDVPLSGVQPVKVSGSYHFLDNDISVAGMSALMKVNGDLLFSESSLHTRNVTANILGGPATLKINSGEGGVVSIQASGQADLDNLRHSLSHPLLNYLHGGSPWVLEITAAKKQFDVLFTSDLVGLVSDLPAPFSKRAAESMPLRFENKTVAEQKNPEQQNMLSLQYGKVLDVNLLCKVENGSINVARGLVNFGGLVNSKNPGYWPTHDGVWVSGTVPELSLQGWESLLGASENSPQMTIAGINLLIQKISGYGYRIDDLRITARSRNDVLITQLSSKAINGEVKWQPQGNGKLTARMKNISLDKNEEGKNEEAKSENPKSVNFTGQPVATPRTARTEFPALDLAADSITLKGQQLGKLELQGEQQGSNWQLKNLMLTNPDGVLKADGKWQMGTDTEQTQLNLKLEINNAGNVLARSGYPNTVKRGSGKLDGKFSWQGRPSEFSYAKLDGTLKLDTGKGQFLKIDPGAGKLLSILSLQSLPQHVTLDFADVFSKGFAFDKITGSAQITHGILTTQDLKIDGSAAKVVMAGQVNLNEETQNLQLRIFPTVGNSTALLSALVAGPVVGIGVYFFSKMMNDPLDQLVSFQYNVSGSWADPNVTKVDRDKLTASPK